MSEEERSRVEEGESGIFWETENLNKKVCAAIAILLVVFAKG